MRGLARHEGERFALAKFELKAVFRQHRRETTKRYLVAFESRTMPEAVCAPRAESLDGQIRDLRMRRSEIVQASDSNPQPKFALGELPDLRDAVHAALESGSVPQQMHFSRPSWQRCVDNRGAIHPVFRIRYGEVRVLGQVVGREGVEPPQLSRRFYSSWNGRSPTFTEVRPNTERRV